MEEFRLIRSPRRRKIAFAFDAQSDQLTVYAPVFGSLKQIEALVAYNAPVIERLKNRMRKLAARQRHYVFAEGGRFLWLGDEYELRFSHRVRAFDGAFLVPRPPAGADAAAYLKKELTTLYQTMAMPYLSGRVGVLAAKFGISYAKLCITSARTRWGSCSARGTLSFSWRLLLWNADIVDYVICHELAHRIEMNHSARFWSVVERMVPDWREKRRFMHDNVREFESF